MQTNAAGNSEETCASYPFGDGLNCTGPAADATEQHFTGKERDAESGLDYFYARYYSSTLGRFMTPDWAAAPTAVPYATFGDPQTLNLYAYVNNNPNTGIDMDGHATIQGEGGGGSDQQSAENQAAAVAAAGADDSAGDKDNSADSSSSKTGANGSSGKSKAGSAGKAPTAAKPKTGNAKHGSGKSASASTPPHGGNNAPKPPPQHDCAADAKNTAIEVVESNFGIDFAGTSTVTVGIMLKEGATVSKVASATSKGILTTGAWTALSVGVQSGGGYMVCTAAQIHANFNYILSNINYYSH